jgi:hypothetical protein
MKTSGSGLVTSASARAQASRSSRPPPRWAMTSKPGGSQRPGEPARARIRRVTLTDATAARVSARAASASSAASAGV